MCKDDRWWPLLDYARFKRFWKIKAKMLQIGGSRQHFIKKAIGSSNSFLRLKEERMGGGEQGMTAESDKQSSSCSEKRVAVVTGANKGIGLEIARQLATRGVAVILTARNEKKGAEAAEKLRLTSGQDGGGGSVEFHRLDVVDPTTVASLVAFVEARHGKLDILVNNAGVNGLVADSGAIELPLPSDGNKQTVDSESHMAEFARFANAVAASKETFESAREAMDTNYYGTKRVTQELIPLLSLSSSPRIVNITSIYGNLEFIPSERIREELDNIGQLTEERVDEIVQEFLRDYEAGKLEEKGWPTSIPAYKLSKAAINAYTRIFARRNPGICANCIHPGFVRTDITWNFGTATTEEGAAGAVAICLLPHGSHSGLYYNKTQPQSFYQILS